MLTTEQKAAEFDEMMDKCRYATWPYGVCSILWDVYKRYRSDYGYDKPGMDYDPNNLNSVIG